MQEAKQASQKKKTKTYLDLSYTKNIFERLKVDLKRDAKKTGTVKTGVAKTKAAKTTLARGKTSKPKQKTKTYLDLSRPIPHQEYF